MLRVLAGERRILFHINWELIGLTPPLLPTPTSLPESAVFYSHWMDHWSVGAVGLGRPPAKWASKIFKMEQSLHLPPSLELPPPRPSPPAFFRSTLPSPDFVDSSMPSEPPRTLLITVRSCLLSLLHLSSFFFFFYFIIIPFLD